jgi:hypothetical protein
MNFIARRLDSSHSHRGFSPVIEQVADSASTVLTVYRNGGLKKTVNGSRLFFGLLSHRAKATV